MIWLIKCEPPAMSSAPPTYLAAEDSAGTIAGTVQQLLTHEEVGQITILPLEIEDSRIAESLFRLAANHNTLLEGQTV